MIKAMVTMVNADISALLDAIASEDEQGVTNATLQLLGPENVPPAKVAARVGIPAAWGSTDGHALNVLSVAGRVADWMRSIPIGPEPHAETRRNLAPALPLVQGFLAAAEGVRKGLPEPHPALPEPISPADVHHAGGPLGALREAIAKQDLTMTRRILLGYYATGTDYRSLLTIIYAALADRYPEGGHILSWALAGTRVQDMANWGDKVPAYIYWYTPLMLDATPDIPEAAVARDYAAQPEHDLGWLRKRLSIPKEEAAGARFQQALMAGDTAMACEATLRALRDGATPMGAAAGMALATAQQVNAVPQGDLAGLLHAGHVLLYVHSVHSATLQTQNPEIWPLLYTAAAAVNSIRARVGAAALESGAASPVSSPIGGLIATSILRSVEQQISAGETANALASARRYLQMGHEPRALAGVIGSVAASRDIIPSQPYTLHILPLVAAAAEEYLTLPRGLQTDGQNALLTAAIRLASELNTGHTLADRVRDAIEALV